jgi:hypothetical protein
MRQTAEPATVEEIFGFIERHTPKAGRAGTPARSATP